MTVAARLQEPRCIQIATEPGSDLHRAALRLADHETVVAPLVASDHNAATAGHALGGDDGSDSQDLTRGEARVVTDGVEDDRVDSPAELESLLTGDG